MTRSMAPLGIPLVAIPGLTTPHSRLTQGLPGGQNRQVLTQTGKIEETFINNKKTPTNSLTWGGSGI